MSWQRRAACRDLETDRFYPEKGANEHTTAAAKRICAGCPVTAECLAYALERDERFGIWGGLSERERRRLRPARRVA
jgi:WhiB family transcriptional regulator, redox-sensing transcriptional regulator